MRNRILVCPLEEDLLHELRGWALVMRIEDPGDVARAARAARRDNTLHAVWLDSVLPLSTIQPSESWRGVPLAIYARGLGNFPEVASKLALLRSLDVRVYLPAGDAQSLLAHRILSSLQIATALVFEDAAPDWEAVLDLLHYAAYGLVPHAPIDPFDHVIEHYRPDAITDFGAVYFDDPSRFVHLDARGRVALRRRDVTAARFIDFALQDSVLEDHIAYQADRDSWRAAFLKQDGCACCPAWRVCQGKFSVPGVVTAAQERSCRSVFIELMDAADNHRTQREKARQLWRP